jgi:hypothetical protein
MHKRLLLFACALVFISNFNKNIPIENKKQMQHSTEKITPAPDKTSEKHTASKILSLDRLLLNYYQTRDDAGQQFDALLELYRRFPTARGQTLIDLKKEFGHDAEKGIRERIISLATQLQAKK